MSKFYILSEEELNKTTNEALREWESPKISKFFIINPAYEVNFDGDLREFIKKKVEDEDLFKKN